MIYTSQIKKLDEQINVCLETMDQMDPTLQEYEQVSKQYDKLMRNKLEIEKALSSTNDGLAKIALEETKQKADIELENIKDEREKKRFRWEKVKYGLGLMTAIGLTVFTCKAEETKALTSKGRDYAKDMFRKIF